MNMSDRNKRGFFVSVDIDNESYRFNSIEESDIKILSVGQDFLLSPSKGIKTRTSLRFTKYVLWQLELISRVVKKKTFSSTTYNEIISDALNDSFFSEKGSESRDKLNIKKYLYRPFRISEKEEKGNKYEFRSLVDLTYSDDYIYRTLAIALFDMSLVTDSEKRLLKSIYTNSRFTTPFREKNSGESEERYLKEILKYIPTVDIDFYSIYRYFGLGVTELFIQQGVNFLEEDIHSPNLGYFKHIAEVKHGWDGEGFEDLLDKCNISEDEYNEAKVVDKLGNITQGINSKAEGVATFLRDEAQRIFDRNHEADELTQGSIKAKYINLINMSAIQGIIED
ncbi:hypothetical protein N9J91_00570 [Gammaproteobacteria bacterium]|nr:hypothetical protein [Gammaproteobacteria bacterium]